MEVKISNRALALFGSCLFFSYLLPYHFLPFSPFYNDWLAVLGVVVLLAYFAGENITSIRMPWIIGVPLGITIVILVQVTAGMLTTPWDACLPVSYFLVCSIAISLGSTISSTKEGSYRLCVAVAAAQLFAALVSVGIASLQFLSMEDVYDPYAMLMLHDPGHTIRPVANIAQPNQLALLFCLSIASLWWLYQVQKIRGSVGLFAALFLLWGLALTQSRIGWIILPLFIAIFLLWRCNSYLVRTPIKSVVALVLFYAGLVVALPLIAQVAGAATVSPLQRMQGPSPRIVMLKQALQMSTTHPWLGVGWFEFGPQQLKIAPDFQITEYSQHSHNIIMNFAAEMGWPATIVIFVILVFWLVKAYYRHRTSKETAFALLVFVAVSVHSMVEYPLWYAYVLIPVSLFLGLVHQEQFGTSQIVIRRPIIGGVAIIALIGMLGVAMDYRRLVSGMWITGWKSFGIEIDNGNIERPVFTIFPQFYEYFEAKNIVPRPGMSIQEISLMERVAGRFGFPDVLEKAALVYALNSKQEEATKTLRCIEKLYSSRYSRIYQSWKNLALKDPTIFSKILQKIPKPENQ